MAEQGFHFWSSYVYWRIYFFLDCWLVAVTKLWVWRLWIQGDEVTPCPVFHSSEVENFNPAKVKAICDAFGFDWDEIVIYPDEEQQ